MSNSRGMGLSTVTTSLVGLSSGVSIAEGILAGFGELRCCRCWR